MKEENEGYQYIQILVNNTTACDENDNGGTVQDPSRSLYKACFELSGSGSLVTDEKKMFFPHRDDDLDRSSQTPSVWTEFPTDECWLWQQKFKTASYRAADTGALVIDPAGKLVVRFNAGGASTDDWYFKDLFARVVLVDEQAPGLIDAVVPEGTYRPGGTLHVSLCFNEPVVFTGSSILQTSWGTLNRQSADGTNVVTYSGIISADAADTLTITALPTDITDMAGHAMATHDLVLALVNVALSNAATLSDPYPYAITYDLDGGTLPSGFPTSYTYVSDAVTLPTPTRQHYIFAGWTGFNLSSATQSVTIPAGSWGDRAYKANWTPISYSINYQLNGGTHTNPDTYTIEDTLTLTAPTRPGYEFTGWTGTGLSGLTKNVTIPAGSSGTRTYTANWSQPIAYTISYQLNGGSVQTANPTQYTVVSNAITLVNPTREHYTFAGWTGTGLSGPTLEVTIPAGSTGSRAYTATWTPFPYAITYDLDGGTLPANPPASYTVEAAVTLPAPTRPGYDFTGWTGTGLDGQTLEVTIPAGSSGSRSYTAHWSPVSYSIDYSLDGGSLPEVYPANYTIESEAITLVNPTRAGYDFTGWTGTGLDGLTLEVIIPTGSYGNRAYTANWQITSYTIEYDYGDVDLSDDPDQLNPGQYTVESVITLINPCAAGSSVFLGWTGTGLGETPVLNVTIPAGSTGNRSYTAHWKSVTYAIEYDYGGIAIHDTGNPGWYYGTHEITLNNPRALRDEVFLGWTGTGLGTVPVLEVTIPEGSTGSRSYTAHWAEDVRGVSWQGSSLGSETLPDSPKTLTSQDTEWSGSCPVVAVGDVTISGRVTVSGNVLLILMDGSNLSASAGITVNSGSS